MSSSYHPQTDGQTERFNGLLEEYLRHFVSANQKNWVNLLDVAQFCFNIQKSSTSNRSPFEVVTGQQPLLPHTVVGPYTGKCPRAYNFTKEWKQNTEIARAYLEKASKRMKKWADERRRPVQYEVGDLVMVKLLPEQLRFLRGRDKRLLRKYEGPMPIISRIGRAAYKVEPLPWMKIHPVFHVSCLKPFQKDMEDPSRNKPSRPSVKINFPTIPDVEDILAERVVSSSTGEPQKEYLVKWRGRGIEDTSWEPEEAVKPLAERVKSPRTSTS